MAESEISLRGGFVTHDPRLDRIPQFDEQSRQWGVGGVQVAQAPLIQLVARSRVHRIDTHLDQGKEGRCVEYSICHDLRASPKVVPQSLIQQILEGKLIYWPAQREDVFAGGSYPGANPVMEGTSVLAGVKVAARLGFYAEYRWAFTLEEAILALGYIGPLLLGINWHVGMRNTDADGWIRAQGPVEGGHAILAVAVKIVWLSGTTDEQKRSPDWLRYIDLDQSYIGLWNSWGPGWGVQGMAKLSIRHFDDVRRARGEVCIPTIRSIPKTLAA